MHAVDCKRQIASVVNNKLGNYNSNYLKCFHVQNLIKLPGSLNLTSKQSFYRYRLKSYSVNIFILIPSFTNRQTTAFWS